MKHTPGKWSVDLETGQINAVNGEVTIGTVYGVDDYPCVYFEGVDDEGVQEWVRECKANALLIAAAPEMYDALERCLPYVETGEYEGDDGAELAPILRAAINKANGLSRLRIELARVTAELAEANRVIDSVAKWIDGAVLPVNDEDVNNAMAEIISYQERGERDELRAALKTKDERPFKEIAEEILEKKSELWEELAKK